MSPGPGITVIDFAASWCKPCWNALPHLQRFSEAFPQIRVLVLSEDNSSAGRDLLVSKLNLTMPVIWDKDHRWAEKYQPKGMPTTMIVDENGKVLYDHVGFSPQKWAQFKTRLHQIQQGRNPQ